MATGNGIRKWQTYVSKSVKNGQKMPFFWAIWVPRICVKVSICIGTNLNDKQTPFIIV